MIKIIAVINIIVTAVIVYKLLSLLQEIKIKYKLNFKESRLYSRISDEIFNLLKRELIPNKFKGLTPVWLLVVMTVIGVAAFLIINTYIKVTITSIVLTLPFFLSPILISIFLSNKEKSNVMKMLPMYIINLKNHVSEDNNIIKAIQMTTLDEPLRKYINQFKDNVSRGMNVMEAFDKLKSDVDVKHFNTFINSCEVCYMNGGDFTSLLKRYVNMITKEIYHKEETKEKAYSDILTLIIMIVLNVLVIVMFVFANVEYAAIIRGTLFGQIILTLNALSYILIAYFVFKLYKEE